MAVPHTGIIDTGYGPTVVFRDPDNMQLEFYVHQNPGRSDAADRRRFRRGAAILRGAQ